MTSISKAGERHVETDVLRNSTPIYRPDELNGSESVSAITNAWYGAQAMPAGTFSCAPTLTWTS